MPSDPRADPIRRAVARGEFPKALALWEDYALELQRDLRGGTFTSDNLNQTRELAEWCCRAALCARAETQARLRQISTARQYGPARPQPAAKISATA